MPVEPAGTVNTGGARGDLTSEDDVWMYFFNTNPMRTKWKRYLMAKKAPS